MFGSRLTDEFARAVYVATGLKLSRHLVNTVFKIFDVDHDDHLSYKEFIGIMKDRLHRGSSWVNMLGHCFTKKVTFFSFYFILLCKSAISHLASDMIDIPIKCKHNFSFKFRSVFITELLLFVSLLVLHFHSKVWGQD